MKCSTFSVLFFLCIIFNFNTNATKERSLSKNSIKSQILQLIKEAFTNKGVIFEIPKKMDQEFNTKKQTIIDELTKKMTLSKTDYISRADAANLVAQTFQYFIDRVKYYQISAWAQTVLSNIKKDDKKSVKSSTVNVPDSLKKLANTPPYLKTNKALNRN